MLCDLRTFCAVSPLASRVGAENGVPCCGLRYGEAGLVQGQPVSTIGNGVQMAQYK